MTSTPKFEGQDVRRRKLRLELQTRGWSAKPTGLRSSRQRPRKNGGSLGLFTMPCEVTGGGLHADNPPHLSLPRRRVADVRLLDVCVQQTEQSGKATGTETMRRSRMESGDSPTARMPGRRNGSILSLVNRAVKSDIFLNGWYNRLGMTTPWSQWRRTTEALCTVCGEYVTRWISPEGNGYCKYCFADRRAAESPAPVPQYLKEAIPLE
jgi:hypothetical protein